MTNQVESEDGLFQYDNFDIVYSLIFKMSDEYILAAAVITVNAIQDDALHKITKSFRPCSVVDTILDEISNGWDIKLQYQSTTLTSISHEGEQLNKKRHDEIKKKLNGKVIRALQKFNGVNYGYIKINSKTSSKPPAPTYEFYEDKMNDILEVIRIKAKDIAAFNKPHKIKIKKLIISKRKNDPSDLADIQTANSGYVSQKKIRTGDQQGFPESGENTVNQILDINTMFDKLQQEDAKIRERLNQMQALHNDLLNDEFQSIDIEVFLREQLSSLSNIQTQTTEPIKNTLVGSIYLERNRQTWLRSQLALTIQLMAQKKIELDYSQSRLAQLKNILFQLDSSHTEQPLQAATNDNDYAISAISIPIPRRLSSTLETQHDSNKEEYISKATSIQNHDYVEFLEYSLPITATTTTTTSKQSTNTPFAQGAASRTLQPSFWSQVIDDKGKPGNQSTPNNADIPLQASKIKLDN